MKKINVFVLAAFAGISVAQAQNPIKKTYPSLDNKDAKVKPGSKIDLMNHSSNKTNGSESLWFTYSGMMNDYLTNQGNSATFNRSGNFLFPDSLPVAAFGDGQGGTVYGSPWVHGLGIILDPKSPAILTSNGDRLLSSYTLDSMAMSAIYTRNHPDPSIVDTLVINIMTNDKGSSTTSNFPSFRFSGTTASNYGVSTLSFMDILFDTMSVMVGGKYIDSAGLIPSALSRQGDMITIKRPLTAADSSLADAAGSAFIKAIDWAVGINVNDSKKGKVVGAFITFKPGYSYKMNDSLSQMNYIRFFSREENDGGFQTYFPGDWNVSLILPQDIRYGNSPGNWNGLTIPSYAYTAPYRFEYHDILWKLTAVTGIAEVKDVDGNVLRNVYPNPANNNADVVVPFTLSKASDVNITVFDAQGRMVKAIASGKFNEGNNQVEVSTSEVPAGLYFVRLDVNGSSLTKTFSVIK
jgi:hypothetical protein